MTHSGARNFLALCALALALPGVGAAERHGPTCDEDNGGLTLPEGFCAFVAADGLGRARDLTVAPNGDVYVAIDGADGGIAALRDADGDGRLEQVEHFGSGGGSGVQYQDDHLYFASDLLILRYPLIGGALVPRAVPEVIITGLLPQRSRRFEVDDDGNLYVDMGAPKGGCETQDGADGAPVQDPCPPDAGVWRFSADTPNQDATTGKRYSTGSRDGIVNAWSTGNGKLYSVRHGSGAGTVPAPTNAAQDTGVPLEQAFDAEAGAPDDLLFYTGKLFPPRYRGGAFAVYHGSGAPVGQAGSRVDFVPYADGKAAGNRETFADGFARARSLRTPSDADYHPLGLAQGPDGSLYISDAERGRIWRVLYGKSAAAVTSSSGRFR